MVVMKALMYGMELYWDGDKDMARKLEIWRNRCLRKVLGAVRSTPVDAMLGELGWKSMSLELDKKVENWGARLVRRGFGERFGEGWKAEAMENGVWICGWEGRILRGLKKHFLNGERYEVQAERSGNIEWKVVIKKDKEEARLRWERKGRKEVKDGVDNKGVLQRLRKGRGWCGECEQRVRGWGKELVEKGWEVEWFWLPGHIGIRENEEVDRIAKDGYFMEEEEEIGKLLTWGRWKQRRKENERRVWKEYWRKDRKGRAYFGNEGGRKCGHGGKRVDSIFLFWMRVGHGKMRGTRYGNRERKCECEGWEDKDHVLLYCLEWVEERKDLEEVWLERGSSEGWVDMEDLLFSEEGTEGVKEFGNRTEWMKRRWKERIV
ncbi:hypothetical protein B9Z19DRAFT_1142669 [Tuber borchii]|uniref:RNase H type-1 domain-containing protein n=1 Tax=Tuber borchii TaxID=42251 RepID=A0A2T7A6R6_TUBBO|nr:hypothetical protein B9Z19DRAFT_1142669 [Tuber borchii]